MARITTEKKTDSAASKQQKRAAAVRAIVDKAEAALKKGVKAVTLAEYIRLVQLLKDLEEDEPRNIRVTWVEPEEKQPKSS